MPRLDPIGRIDNPNERDFDPLVIPIVAYTLDREEVIREFRFRPSLSFGYAISVFRGNIEDAEKPAQMRAMLKFLDACLMPDDLEEFWAFLGDPHLVIEQQTLSSLYTTLAEQYAARPTLPSSASRNGSSTSSRTQLAGARARASGSPKRRSRSAST
jgi:hypothetical protein